MNPPIDSFSEFIEIKFQQPNSDGSAREKLTFMITFRLRGFLQEHKIKQKLNRMMFLWLWELVSPDVGLFRNQKHVGSKWQRLEITLVEFECFHAVGKVGCYVDAQALRVASSANPDWWMRPISKKYFRSTMD